MWFPTHFFSCQCKANVMSWWSCGEQDSETAEFRSPWRKVTEMGLVELRLSSALACPTTP